jgi:hypothetical protein
MGGEDQGLPASGEVRGDYLPYKNANPSDKEPKIIASVIMLCLNIRGLRAGTTVRAPSVRLARELPEKVKDFFSN